jgi:signal transduction histidine kinase/ActR/RegA family two-component response regulator
MKRGELGLGLILVAAGALFALAFVQMARFERASADVARIESLGRDIMRLDAVLTLSATLGAATGDPVWQARYDGYVPELDAALGDALRAGGDEARAHLRAVSQSNDALIDLETRAFALAAKGDVKAAMSTMLSEAYAADKAKYSEGVRLALAATQARAAKIRDEMWAAVVVSLGAAFSAACVYLWRRNRLRAQRRQSRLQASLIEAEAARLLLEKAVDERTAELRDAAERAQASEQAKTRFLANMSHEIRTPLNGVIGLAGALSDTPLAGRQKEMVELIRVSGETLDRLVSEILDFSKIEAGKLELHVESINLRAAVESAAELLRARAEAKGVAFVVRSDLSARGLFESDAHRIRQIVANLVSNAVKFTDAGSVEVSLSAVDALDGAARVTIVVADTGIGFDEATARRLFSPFEQADASIGRRFGGTGLGLSICKTLAALMDGSVSAASTPGRGSRFTVELSLQRSMPLAEFDRFSVLGADSNDGCAEAPADLRGMRVLLAEDHPVNQRVVQLLLEPHGIVVTVAADGEEALFAFRNAEYDVVLMDMMMPKIDGVAAARGIRAFERERGLSPTPVVMLTANAMQLHIDQALEAGCDAHLPKPVTPRSLLRCLQDAVVARNAGGGRAVA